MGPRADADRVGDAILGGGIELVYKLSDILDLSLPEDSGIVCLDVQSQVTWLPRKPTTYVFAVHAIEAHSVRTSQALAREASQRLAEQRSVDHSLRELAEHVEDLHEQTLASLVELRQRTRTKYARSCSGSRPRALGRA